MKCWCTVVCGTNHNDDDNKREKERERTYVTIMFVCVMYIYICLYPVSWAQTLNARGPSNILVHTCIYLLRDRCVSC